jgi:hypothetical protein
MEDNREATLPIPRTGQADASMSGAISFEIDVSALMGHIHRQVASPSNADLALPNPLWVNLDNDWSRIHYLIYHAERDSGIEDLLAQHLPSLPKLAGLARFMRLQALIPALQFLCLLVIRLIRPLILKAARRQERFNRSLVGCGRGLAHRLADCESTVLDHGDRLDAVEEKLRGQLAAQTERIRSLERQLLCKSKAA